MFETQVPDTCTPHVLFRASKWPILNSGMKGGFESVSTMLYQIFKRLDEYFHE